MEQDLQNTFQNRFKFEKPNEHYRLFYHPTEKIVDRKTVKKVVGLYFAHQTRRTCFFSEKTGQIPPLPAYIPLPPESTA
jgi:hypothetical protein